MKLSINILKENPLNKQIYGDDDENQLKELAEKIKSSGWIKPIVINKEYLILSGHRRVKAAMSLNIESVECEVVNIDEDKQVEIFLNENHYRRKTNIQLQKEGDLYFEIEKKKALQRQLAGVDLRVPEPQGRTTELVAKQLGISESSYKKLRSVGKRIEEEEDPAIKWFLSDLANENITAASTFGNKPPEFVQEVITRTNGDVRNVRKIIGELEQEEIKKKTPLPPIRGQIIYAQLTDNPSESLAKIPISELAENDSVLFLWSKPTQLRQALQLIGGWGFNYKTCFIWKKDKVEVSDNAEILTISVKGNPKMIPQTVESYNGKTAKPKMVKQLIDDTYIDVSKVAITFSDSTIEDWKTWTV